MAIEIYDMHTHIYPQKVAEKAVNAIGDFYNIPMLGKGFTEELIKDETEAGVSKALVSSAATSPMQVTAVNSFIAKEVSEHADKLYGFGTLHPYYYEIPNEIERMKALGLRGVKLHPDFQKFAIDDPCAFTMYECCEAADFPILFHTGDKRFKYSNPSKVLTVLKNFPKLRVICAHLGGYSEWREAQKVEGYLGNPNVYIDTSSAIQMMDKRTALKIIRKHDINNIFWGSDYPMWNPKTELENFMKIRLTDDEREKILSLNAIAFLKGEN